jgi:hypothetical protein
MKKSVRPRGRPAIKPYIERLIASRVFDEQKKPEEKRMPSKVLAFEIQQQLKRLGEQSPELSTLEKRISRYSSTYEFDSIDDPWTISSLSKYDIPPEALPAVMHQQAEAIKWNRTFSIREALWVGRFYYILKGTEWEFESYPGLVEMFANQYAKSEMLDEVLRDIGKSPDKETKLSLFERYYDSFVYYFMTKDEEPIKRLIKEIKSNPQLADWFFEDRDYDTSLAEENFEELLKRIRQNSKRKGGTK